MSAAFESNSMRDRRSAGRKSWNLRPCQALLCDAPGDPLSARWSASAPYSPWAARTGAQAPGSRAGDASRRRGMELRRVGVEPEVDLLPDARAWSRA